MKVRTVLALIGMSLLTQGCQLAWDATTNVVFETCLFTDTMTSRVHYCLQANEAWKEYLSHHAGGDYSPDFAKGFKAGYKDFLYAGGDTSPPPAPPMKYWKIRFQTPEGREASKMWSLGYAEGSMAAKASGARGLIVVPYNRVAPPDSSTGTLGIPLLPPQFSPPGAEIDLPAPRPEPAKTVPPQASTTSSIKPGLSPSSPKAMGSGTSRAGQPPESDSMPVQSIRSILSNDRTAPASTTKTAPSGSALETPRVKEGAAVPLPKSPSLPTHLPPSLPALPLTPSQAAPDKIAPPQAKETNSAKPRVLSVPQNTGRSGIGQQPTTASGTTPSKPIGSLTSSQAPRSGDAQSESLPPQPIRSLLSGNGPSLNP